VTTRGGLKPTPITDRQRRSIALAIASDVPIKHLHRSGRFKGVPYATIARIAEEAGVARKRQPGNRAAAPGGKRAP
jgi:hypothetical protein